MPADYQAIDTPPSMTSNRPVMKRIEKSIHPGLTAPLELPILPLPAPV